MEFLVTMATHVPDGIGPRAAFLVAGAGALAGLGVLVPGLRAPDTSAAAPERVSL